MRRIFVRGSNIGIRTFAVIVLALGLAGGLFAGTHTKKADTLTTISAANAAEIDARVEADRLDTQQLQEAKSESFQKQRTQEYLAGVAQAKLVAARKANALAKAKAEASRKAAEATAARKEAASRVSRSSDRVTASEETSGGTAPPAPVDCQNYSGNKQVGCSLLAWGGFSTSQMSCLDKLWTRESGWSTTSGNQSSGAYGIPQALPGSKMGSYGSDWQTNPVTQIKWGLQYIKGRYSTPCGAWAAFQSQGWY